MTEKQELVERINNRCAEEIKDYRNSLIIWGTLFLIGVFHGVSTKDISGVFALPAAVVLMSLIEMWWSNRLSKCKDATRLVNMYKNYSVFSKVIVVVALVIAVIYYVYELIYESFNTTQLVILNIVFVAVVCYCLWFLFFTKKSTINRDMESLRKLVQETD